MNEVTVGDVHVPAAWTLTGLFGGLAVLGFCLLAAGGPAARRVGVTLLVAAAVVVTAWFVLAEVS